MHPSSLIPKTSTKYLKLNLVNTILGTKYCIYKQLSDKGYKLTYVAMNRDNYKDYLIKFYRLGQIEQQQQLLKAKTKILKKAEAFTRINSNYVMKCYDIYVNQLQIAVVYEYLQNDTLEQQINNKKVPDVNYQRILKQIYMGVRNINQNGYLIKKIDFNQIVFKNGYYKIRDFDIFLSQFRPQDKELPPQIRNRQQNGKNGNNQELCDVWALGLFYLKLIIPIQKRQLLKVGLDRDVNKLQSVFTKQLEQNVKMKKNNLFINFLKKSLKFDHKNRISWQQIDKIFNNKSQLSQQGQNLKKLQVTLAKSQIIKQKDKQLPCTKILFINQKQNTSKKLNSQLYQIQNQRYITYYDENILLQKAKNCTADSMVDWLRLRQFIIKNQQQQNVQYLIKDKKDESYKIYEFLQTKYFQAQKSEYIIKKIINPIQKYKIINLTQRQSIQFMYLLALKCFTALSYAQKQLSLHQQKKISQNLQIFNSYQQLIHPIYNQAQKIFTKYSKQLTGAQDKVSNILIDKLSNLLNHRSKIKKDNFLTGILGIDFQNQQLIKYICKYFSKKIQQEMKKNLNQKQTKQKHICENVYHLCMNLQNIFNFEVKHDIFGRLFAEEVYHILQQSKNNDEKKISQNVNQKSKDYQSQI